jgi:hypothetical protein
MMEIHIDRSMGVMDDAFRQTETLFDVALMVLEGGSISPNHVLSSAPNPLNSATGRQNFKDLQTLIVLLKFSIEASVAVCLRAHEKSPARIVVFTLFLEVLRGFRFQP